MSRPRDKNSVLSQIREALAKNPNIDTAVLAERVGCTPERAAEYRWRLKNADRWVEIQRRHSGSRPFAEWREELRTSSAAKAKSARKRLLAVGRLSNREHAVLDARAQGLSFDECALLLKVSRNTIAGIVFRAQQKVAA